MGKIWRERIGSENGLEVRPIKEFSEGIDAFWNKIKDHYDFIIVRDSKHLNWRFCDPRGGEHDVFLFEKNGEILGYSVLRINNQDECYPVGQIVDLVSLPGEKKVQIEMFKHAVEFFEDREINCVLYFAVENSSQMRDALRFDFIAAPNDFRMWFAERNSFKTNFLEDVSSHRLFFSMGDTDWI